METLEKSRVCRLCGKHSGISIDIFDKNDNHFKKINSILPISVHEMDLLPKQICHRCSYKLEEFHKFYIECLKTDTTLKNQLSWMCKETDSKIKKPNGVPMVQIENVKIKCEPHEIDPLLKNVGLIEFPLNGLESDLPECLLYTTFTNTSRCQCYCDNKSDPTTGKEAISKDCRHINLPKTPDFTYLDDKTSKNSDILWKKQETRNLFTSKELRALSKDNIGIDNSSLLRNLRPRKRSVDYVGGKRKNRSSESLERPQSTEPPTTIIITDLIKNEPIDIVETARTLRPRKQLKTEVKSRSKSADRCNRNRSKAKAQSEIRELKIKREVEDEIIDVRLDDVREKVDKTRKDGLGKKWRELYIGIERSDTLGNGRKRCDVRSVSVCLDNGRCENKRDRKEKSERSVSRCEPIYGKNVHSGGRKILSGGDDKDRVPLVRIRESAKDLEEVGKDRQSFNKDQGASGESVNRDQVADKAVSKEFSRDRRSVSRNRGNATDSAVKDSKGCSRDRQSASRDRQSANRDRQSVSKEGLSFSKDSSAVIKEGSTNTAAKGGFPANKGCAATNAANKGSAATNAANKACAASNAANKASAINAAAKGSTIINAASKTTALNAAVKASADTSQLTASSANEEATFNVPFNKCERNEHTALTDNTPKDDDLNLGHTFTKISFSKEATSDNILNKEGTIRRSCNFSKDRNNFTNSESTRDTNTRSTDTNKSINSNSKNANSINTNSKNTNTINTNSKNINSINTSDNSNNTSNKNNNTSDNSININNKSTSSISTSDKSINTNNKSISCINTNNKSISSINTSNKSINPNNKSISSINTSEKSINSNNIQTKSNKESTKHTKSTIYINKNLNIITADMKKNGGNFLKNNRQTNRTCNNKELLRNRLRNIGKERKLQLKRLPMQFSPKMLRSHDLYLRSGRVKLTNTHNSKKKFCKDIKINNYLEKFNETKSKFLNLDVKHLCEKCNYTFANKELFRLHACYSN
ncbi:uncharacterized protein DDB_G0287625-like [Leptopilina heterotoma]|uniref:uncharacterized protein DDB_G0287625-like n=1 Tax=Leptopilina heterotoma TaxID=63436 RepID=UPI001CA8EB8D|nr:uncharacterized protein DDB_G0287625-like [Leptopilina heterotoma]